MASVAAPDFATLLKFEDFKSMPWKNGQGQTQEIAIAPYGARFDSGNFHWRFSSAEITASGPFSLFPGFDRCLLLLSGDKLDLKIGQTKKSISTLETIRFAGTEEVQAELVAGVVKDLNVIFKKGLKVDMNVIQLKTQPRSFLLKAKTVFLFAAEGAFSVSAYPGELEFELRKGDVLRVDELPKEESKAERLVLLEPKPKVISSKIIAVEIW